MEMVKVSDFEDKSEAPEASPSEPPKRKRGRPKGLPKTGGRQKATKNWTSAEIRDALLGKSEAIETLADICAGRLIRVSGPTGKTLDVYPTLQERLKAADLVLKKVVPDLQAASIEMTGKDGKDLYPSEQQDARQLSRAILQVLGDAVLDDAPEPASEPIPRAQHELTAQRFEEVDEIEALDLSDTPAPAGVGPPIGDEVGERELVGARGDEIRCIEVRAGRSRWAIISHRGEHITSMWATRDDARRACEQFIETGMISR